MAHAQKPDFVFRRNGRVHLDRRGRQFSRLPAAEVCASAVVMVVMLDTPCSKVVWRVLVTHSIRQFPLNFPSRASTCAITLQLTLPPADIKKLCILPHSARWVSYNSHNKQQFVFVTGTDYAPPEVWTESSHVTYMNVIFRGLRNSNLTRQAMYVSRNIEARSCNQRCSGKAISITYSESVNWLRYPVPTRNAYAPYCPLLPVRLYNIFLHYLISGMILGGAGVCFDLHYNFCLKYFSF